MSEVCPYCGTGYGGEIGDVRHERWCIIVTPCNAIAQPPPVGDASEREARYLASLHARPLISLPPKRRRLWNPLRHRHYTAIVASLR